MSFMFKKGVYDVKLCAYYLVHFITIIYYKKNTSTL